MCTHGVRQDGSLPPARPPHAGGPGRGASRPHSVPHARARPPDPPRTAQAQCSDAAEMQRAQGCEGE